MSDSIPDFGIKITTVEIVGTKGDKFPAGTNLYDSWEEVEGGETVTRQECHRDDGTAYLRTIGPNGFVLGWYELSGDSTPRTANRQ